MRRWKSRRCGRCKGPATASDEARQVAEATQLRDLFERRDRGRHSLMVSLVGVPAAADAVFGELDDAAWGSAISQRPTSIDEEITAHIQDRHVEMLLAVAPPSDDPYCARAQVRLLNEYDLPWFRASDAFQRLVTEARFPSVLRAAAEQQPNTDMLRAVAQRTAELRIEFSASRDNRAAEADETLLVLGYEHCDDPEIVASVLDGCSDTAAAARSVVDGCRALDRRGVPVGLHPSVAAIMLRLGGDCPAEILEAAAWHDDTASDAAAHPAASETVKAAGAVVADDPAKQQKLPRSITCGRYLNNDEGCANTIRKAREGDWCGRCNGKAQSQTPRWSPLSVPDDYVPLARTDGGHEGMRLIAAREQQTRRNAAHSDWRDRLDRLRANPDSGAIADIDNPDKFAAALRRVTPFSKVAPYSNQISEIAIRELFGGVALCATNGTSLALDFNSTASGGSPDAVIDDAMRSSLASGALKLRGLHVDADGRRICEFDAGNNAALDVEAASAQHSETRRRQRRPLYSFETSVSASNPVDIASGTIKAAGHGAAVVVSASDLADLHAALAKNQDSYHTKPVVEFAVSPQGQTSVSALTGYSSYERADSRPQGAGTVLSCAEDGAVVYVTAEALRPILASARAHKSDTITVGIPGTDSAGEDPERLPVCFVTGPGSVVVQMPHAPRSGVLPAEGPFDVSGG